MVGINAIPAFVLDARLLLVGAYPHEAFEQRIRAARDDEGELTWDGSS